MRVLLRYYLDTTATSDLDLDMDLDRSQCYLGRAEAAFEFHGHILLQVVHPLILEVLQGDLATQLGHFL